MSGTFDDPSSGIPVATIVEERDSQQGSLIESIVDSFFQEKNIKWMLVVGAAIVFGSSLMLVTKAWPDWTISLKFLTILGYTSVIFCGAEISRRRLGLRSTGIVLQTLTLLLLPVCFLSLIWLSSGTAVQDGLLYLGLAIPAMGFTWFASRTILDHWLKGRQTTFLVSFCLLCFAGAVPPMTSSVTAFAFIGLCWAVFTAGIIKVNRHTFWLAEQHQLPRIFGFLPIAMLGLQFVILVSLKAITALPIPWIGFAVVLVSATILMTARTVADVHRRRTGDLTRPLPWSIVVPLFSGLVLTVLGVALSLVGFSFSEATTFATVPTAILAAIVFGVVAKDTRHQGIVWACLGAVLIAYQCSPPLFADLVQAARSAAADAINQERVPLSLYGITYLPLLGGLALLSRRLVSKGQQEFSQPVKQFVSLLAISLFAVALADIVLGRYISPFVVSAANFIAFLFYAICFRDRRYALPSLTAFVLAVALAIPGLNQMQYTSISIDWIPTVLAGLALAMAATGLPDRLIHRIPLDHKNSFMSDLNGSDHGLVQWTGCAIAMGLGSYWIATTAINFREPLTTASLIQFGILMTALMRFTLKQTQYLSAAAVWVLTGYATIRWAMGLDLSIAELISNTTFALLGLSTFSYAIVRWIQAQIGADSIRNLRPSIGFKFGSTESERVDFGDRQFVRKVTAMAVPLLDLSTIGLLFVFAIFHVPALLTQHALILIPSLDILNFGIGTPVVLVWLTAISFLANDRIAAACTAMMLPLSASAMLITTGFVGHVSEVLVVWCVVQGTVALICTEIMTRWSDSKVAETMSKIAKVWLVAGLVVGCLCLDLAARVVSLMAVSVLARCASISMNDRMKATVAIFSNVNLLWFVAWIGGCSGWFLPGSLVTGTTQVIPLLFVAGAVSILVFDQIQRFLKRPECDLWAGLLRISMVILGACAMLEGPLDGLSIAIMTIGFIGFFVAEIWQAIQQDQEQRVWNAVAIAAVGTGFLFLNNVLTIGSGFSQFVLLGLSLASLVMAHGSSQSDRYKVFLRPAQWIGWSLPAAVGMLAVGREFMPAFQSYTAINALSLMIGAGIYFHQSALHSRRIFCLPAVAMGNASLLLLWHALDWSAPELYLVPLGISVLGFTEVMKKEIPAKAHTPLQYIGLLTILCSPLMEVLGGSWVHILSLMFLSVAVILAAIGLRIRSLVYAGSAFLLADLVAMVVRSTAHNPNTLWIFGLLLGGAVIGLAAFCENHREKLLARIRLMSAELATWN